jgi:DNA-binding TFAR19-related protein (PDSD5 family)
MEVARKQSIQPDARKLNGVKLSRCELAQAVTAVVLVGG